VIDLDLEKFFVPEAVGSKIRPNALAKTSTYATRPGAKREKPAGGPEPAEAAE
jgi:hypothetical protein